MLRSKVLGQDKNHKLIPHSKWTEQKTFYKRCSDDPLFLQIIINIVKVQVEVDTGAGASLVPISTFKKLLPDVRITQSTVRLLGIPGTIDIVGSAEVLVSSTADVPAEPLTLHVCQNTKKYNIVRSRMVKSIVSLVERNIRDVP